MRIAARRLWTENGFEYDKVIDVENGIIAGIDDGTEGDISCDTAVPGFIDEHVHGGFGTTVMHCDADGMLKWLDFLLKTGVTQVLSGVYTASLPAMRRGLAVAKEVMERQAAGAGGAMLAGVHLEGPFISKNALGAMDEEAVLEPSIENYKKLTEGYEDIIKLITIAPEVPGAHELIKYVRSLGIPVLAGHTAATDAEGREAFKAGVQGITHTFNASTPIKHRAPGILAQSFVEDDIYNECICDFVHVHETCVKLIYRCKGPERMIIVSDAVETTGLPDGEYTFGGSVSIVKNGESRTVNGNLNGGGMVPIGEIRNLAGAGIPQWDCFRMASLTPAEFLGIPGGRIAVGERAEIACLNDKLETVAAIRGTVYAAGDGI